MVFLLEERMSIKTTEELPSQDFSMLSMASDLKKVGYYS